MPIAVSCANCGANYKVPDDKAGRRFACKKCEEPLQVPELGNASPELVETPSEPAEASKGRGAKVESRRRRPRTGQPANRNSSQADRSEGGSGRPRLQRRPPSNLPKVAAYAAAAALAGGLLWGGIIVATQYEIGWVAIGVGAGCACAAKMAGGFGARDGLVVGLIAVAGILLGKFIGYQSILNSEMDGLHTALSAAYSEYKSDSKELRAREAKGPLDEEATLEFIADRSYGAGNEAMDVTSEELAYFRRDSLPILRRIQNGQTEQQFVDKEEAVLLEGVDLSFTSSLLDTSDGKSVIFDILFIALGFATALGTVVKEPAFIREDE